MLTKNDDPRMRASDYLPRDIRHPASAGDLPTFLAGAAGAAPVELSIPQPISTTFIYALFQ
jgi:hypothetical protein